MVALVDKLSAYVKQGDRAQKPEVTGDDLRSFTDYDAHVKSELDTAVSTRSREKIIEQAKRVTEAEKSLGKASEHTKEIRQEFLRDAEEKLADIVHDNRDHFHDAYNAQKEAITILKDQHADAIRDLEDEFIAARDKLAESVDMGASKGAVDDVDKQIKGLEKRHKSAQKALNDRVEDAIRTHEKEINKLERAAEKVQAKSGHDLMEGISKAEKTAAAELGEVAKTAEKGKVGFAKGALGIGLGGIVGGWIGNKVVGEDNSTLGTIIGGGIGATGGYMLAKKLAVGAAKSAHL